MKTLLLLLLLIPTLVEARTVNVVVGQPTAAATPDACLSCPSDGDGGDMICEDWEPTGALCTGWTETTTNCTTLDDDASHTGSWAAACTDYGSQTLKVKYTVDGTSPCYTRKTVTSSSTFYVQFYLNVTDIGTLAASGAYQVFSIANDTRSYVYLKVLYHSSTQYHVQLNYYRNDATWATSNGSALLDLDKYHRINLYTDSATNTATVKVDGALDINVANLYPYSTMKYIYTGSLSDAQESAEFELDMLKVDNDTEPSECAL